VTSQRSVLGRRRQHLATS